MVDNCELGQIKAEEQAAFQRKQAAWAAFDDARNRTRAAYEVMQAAWKERRDARDEMEREYTALCDASAYYHEVWDGYTRLRSENNSRIRSIRRKANSEHAKMKRCFDQACFEYENGDKSDARAHSIDGRAHKEERDKLNAEVAELARAIRDARADAEQRAPKVDNSAFLSAKTKFEQAKERHKAALAEFKIVKTEKERLKVEFEAAQAEHECLKEKLRQCKLNPVKTTKE